MQCNFRISCEYTLTLYKDNSTNLEFVSIKISNVKNSITIIISLWNSIIFLFTLGSRKYQIYIHFKFELSKYDQWKISHWNIWEYNKLLCWILFHTPYVLFELLQKFQWMSSNILLTKYLLNMCPKTWFIFISFQ